MMEKLVVVDGSNLLFQMFYGMPARIVNRDGRAIQGTIGFVGALLKMIRRLEPTHLLVVFDGEGEKERYALDPEYKSNREDFSLKSEEEVPFSQLPDIYGALDSLGICHEEAHTCEADDWIAGYVRRYSKTMEMVVVSQDSDFFQLISEQVTVFRYRGEQSVVCNPSYIREKLGIEPAQYADFKSMTGDTADHIKGAEKIGPKTAAELLREFGDLDHILANAEQIKKPSVRASIIKNQERLRLNYRLIKLAGDVELPFLPEKLIYTYRGETSTQVLKKIGVLP